MGRRLSNNKWLVSGRGALIMNPPSAWAVAKRDAPKVAEQLWTHGFAAGPKGRYAPFVPLLLGHLELQQEPGGGQEPDRPPVAGRRRSRRWSRRAAATTCRRSPTSPPSRPGPRKGRRRARSITIPIRNNHQILSIAGAPAPHKIGEQIYVQALQTQMAVRHFTRRGDGKDARLGGQRARRLHAQLRRRAGGSTPATGRGGRALCRRSTTLQPTSSRGCTGGRSRPARQCRRGPSVVGAGKLVLPHWVRTVDLPLTKGVLYH